MPDCRASLGDNLAARSIMPLLLLSLSLFFWFAPPTAAHAATAPVDSAGTALERSPAPASHNRDRLLSLPWLSADRTNPFLPKQRRMSSPAFDNGHDGVALAATPQVFWHAPGMTIGCARLAASKCVGDAHAFRSRAPPRHLPLHH